MPAHTKLARIHIAKKELALSEESYRDILWLNFKVRSAGELTEQQATELIKLFKAKGWEPKVDGPRAKRKKED
jgi:hypothetical protein